MEQREVIPAVPFLNFRITELESTAKLLSFYHEAWDGLMLSNSMFFRV